MANKRQDFILDQDGDFPLEDTFVNGVIQNTPYSDSDIQHIVDDIIYTVGSLKSDPSFGFGVTAYESSEYNNSIFDSLNKVLSKDGYLPERDCVKKVNGGGFTIDTAYISNNY